MPHGQKLALAALNELPRRWRGLLIDIVKKGFVLKPAACCRIALLLSRKCLTAFASRQICKNETGLFSDFILIIVMRGPDPRIQITGSNPVMTSTGMNIANENDQAT
ncbi:MAG TPA: hypothetical protein VFM05_07355 [Candidatus Saccharimonadales bacterium]|nr:hypothetical protein [Candidatus Saccharimonadales bacterium]